LATRNPGKLKEFRELLADLPLDVVGLEAFGDIPEPEETGQTFAENARDKANYYATATGQWCLADDSGLVVDALAGQPGVRSARYAHDEVPPGSARHDIDQANNRKLLRELTGTPDEARTARFVCHVALAEPDGVRLEADGVVQGRILHVPRGDNGFGYDPLFFLDEKGCTTAELPAAEKNELSHRGQALRKLVQLLRTSSLVKST